MDYRLHSQIRYAFGITLHIHVPEPFAHILPKNDRWWREHGILFPPTKRTPYPDKQRLNILVAERILPLPKVVRLCLMDAFCHEDLKEIALHDHGNKDALARVYLGTRRPAVPHPTEIFLRNFELTLDKIDRLKLPKLEYAQYIAEALAVIHWEAEIDGRDIEFVLGGSPTVLKDYTVKCDTQPQDTEMSCNFQRREVKLWVLDFNQCRPMTMDASGCQKAAAAFWDNDAYYPRPTSTQETELWDRFELVYLETADAVLEDKFKLKGLPKQFLDAVKIEGQRRFPDGTDSKLPPRAESSTGPSASSSTESSFTKRKVKPRIGRNIDLESLAE